MAMTVPNTWRKANEDKRNERKPTTSVVMAMSRAIDVKVVPCRMARWRAARSKSRSVTRPSGFRVSSSVNSSRTRKTTCKP